VGAGAGRGFNVNVGWKARGMGDSDYLVGPADLGSRRGMGGADLTWAAMWSGRFTDLGGEWVRATS
jgi:hypothetical protein